MCTSIAGNLTLPHDQYSMNITTEIANTLRLPRDDNGPVFDAPWQAEVFAFTLLLHERDVFSWSDWADALANAIRQAQQAGDADHGDTYYHHWLAALETLLVERGIAEPDQLTMLHQIWDDAARRTPHGEVIALSDYDKQRAGLASSTNACNAESVN